jgi:hypothetical protein
MALAYSHLGPPPFIMEGYPLLGGWRKIINLHRHCWYSVRCVFIPSISSFSFTFTSPYFSFVGTVHSLSRDFVAGHSFYDTYLPYLDSCAFIRTTTQLLLLNYHSFIH